MKFTFYTILNNIYRVGVKYSDLMDRRTVITRGHPSANVTSCNFINRIATNPEKLKVSSDHLSNI